MNAAWTIRLKAEDKGKVIEPETHPRRDFRNIEIMGDYFTKMVKMNQSRIARNSVEGVDQANREYYLVVD